MTKHAASLTRASRPYSLEALSSSIELVKGHSMSIIQKGLQHMRNRTKSRKIFVFLSFMELIISIILLILALRYNDLTLKITFMVLSLFVFFASILVFFLSTRKMGKNR